MRLAQTVLRARCDFMFIPTEKCYFEPEENMKTFMLVALLWLKAITLCNPSWPLSTRLSFCSFLTIRLMFCTDNLRCMQLNNDIVFNTPYSVFIECGKKKRLCFFTDGKENVSLLETNYCGRL